MNSGIDERDGMPFLRDGRQVCCPDCNAMVDVEYEEHGNRSNWRVVEHTKEKYEILHENGAALMYTDFRYVFVKITRTCIGSHAKVTR